MSRRRTSNASLTSNSQTKRAKRESIASSCIVCPACTLSVRGEKAFKSHYTEELERIKKPLGNLLSKTKLFQMKLRSNRNDQIDEEHSDGDEANVETLSLENREKTLQEIKKRKYSRHAEMFLISLNKNHNKDGHSTTPSNTNYDLFSCVVCNEFLDSSENHSLRHLAKCFAKKELDFNLYSSDDEEGETVEEFSWAGQTWIRASSLLDADIRCEGKLTRLEMDDGDEELDVDGDQSCTFGDQQFYEADIIPCLADDDNKKNQQLLRQAVSTVIVNNKNNSNKIELKPTCGREQQAFETLESIANGDDRKLIHLLKERVTDIQHKAEQENNCPICMGPYNKPVVSLSCWHVCCSECWLQALGAKKLCPKCNTIVSPSQLRKIFL